MVVNAAGVVVMTGDGIAVSTVPRMGDGWVHPADRRIETRRTKIIVLKNFIACIIYGLVVICCGQGADFTRYIFSLAPAQFPDSNNIKEITGKCTGLSGIFIR
jgi:hypothetical protein